ncbi:MAG: patatin-like phospholipase family protein [Burkholderiales bacterium]|nr:patatin-like phospholipase family protein [Burkholderiales bacterium]
MTLRTAVRVCAVAVCCTSWAGPLAALEPTTGAAARAAAAPRPRVGLALGGGGARAAAHIGVLEVLERLRVPVDCVAGTSMGAVVAGAFAAGVAPKAMSVELARADWSDMFVDEPDWDERNFRNKRLTQRFLSGTEIGINPHGLQYRPGVLTGQKIKLFLNRLVHGDRSDREIQDLPLTLSIIATDIGNGERVVIRDGSLSKAMRASMSIPGLMAPVEYDGRLLVDGGLVDNVPIQEVRERCNADVVIAVNVGSPLLDATDVTSLFSVTAQMVGILTEQNVGHSLASLRRGDVFIKPEMGDITATDFERHGQAVQRGRDAALASAARLRALAVGELEYAAWWSRITAGRGEAPRVDQIEVAGSPQLHPQAVLRHITQELGQTLDIDRLHRDLLRAYGDAHFESADYALLPMGERHVLRVMPQPKRWGPDFFRFAAGVNSTLKPGSTYSLRAAYQKTLLNRLGGEFTATGEVGTTKALAVDVYQPLDPGQRSFIEVSARAARAAAIVFENDDKLSEYEVSSRTYGIAVGLNLGLIGQLRLGWMSQVKRYDLDIGPPVFPPGPFHTPGWFTGVDFDQMNHPSFPSKGWAASVSYFAPNDAAFTRLSAEGRAAMQAGAFVVAGRIAYTDSPHGVLPFHEAASLGGLLNLSAYATDQFLGDEVQYAQVRIERVLQRLPIGLSGDLRAGLALEAGRIGVRYTETSRAGWQDSVFLYLGGPTPVGPLYLGYARSSSGSANAYLFIGSL